MNCIIIKRVHACIYARKHGIAYIVLYCIQPSVAGAGSYISYAVMWLYF